MEIFLDVKDKINISVFCDKGTVPKIEYTGEKALLGRPCKKELRAGNLTIQIFERDV